MQQQLMSIGTHIYEIIALLFQIFKIGSLMKNNDCKHSIRFNRHFLCINAMFMDRATGRGKTGGVIVTAR